MAVTFAPVADHILFRNVVTPDAQSSTADRVAIAVGTVHCGCANCILAATL